MRVQQEGTFCNIWLWQTPAMSIVSFWSSADSCIWTYCRAATTSKNLPTFAQDLHQHQHEFTKAGCCFSIVLVLLNLSVTQVAFCEIALYMLKHEIGWPSPAATWTGCKFPEYLRGSEVKSNARFFNFWRSLTLYDSVTVCHNELSRALGKTIQGQPLPVTTLSIHPFLQSSCI